MSIGLRVAAYYRMSSDEQTQSIQQQEKEVRRFCESNRFVIVDEYHDSGKSGSKDIAKRTAFHRMIADSGSGKWQAIVCYDTSRFGRLDSISGAEFKKELRKHGVWLETCKDGRIDWTTSMGRLTDALLSEKNHEYSLNLSHAAIRGRMEKAEEGWWAHGHIPFGYDREYVEGDRTIGVYPRHQKNSKARNWRTKLRVNEKEAVIVKEIFSRLATEDVSVRRLSVEFNKRKVPAPGAEWTPQQLRHVIKERAYIGQTSFGFGRKVREAHNRVGTKIVEGACPSIVDQKTWTAAQQKIAERRQKRSNSSQERSGALSGILVCGHCGKPLHVRHRAGQPVSYVCSSGTQRPHVGCKHFSVKEDTVIDAVCERLFDAVDAALLDRLQVQPKKKQGTEVEALKSAMKKLETTYERAKSNLLKVDPSMFAEVQADALKLKADLERSRNTLAIAESDAGREEWKQVETWWKSQTVGVLRERKEFRKPSGKVWQIEAVAGEQLRALLKTVKAQLVLHWTIRGNRFYTLKTGVLTADVLSAPEHLPSDPNGSCARRAA